MKLFNTTKKTFLLVLGTFSMLLQIPTAFAQQTSDKTVASQTSDQIQGLAGSILQAIPLWITGMFVIIASFVVAKIVKSSVENKMSEQGFEQEHQEIQIVISRAASASVLVVGITIGLKIAGIDLTNIIAAAAFGIGFAMKDFIMNFFAGIIILLQRQFTIGDWIKIGGTTGVIEAIQSRYTIVRNFDGTKVIMPNADLFKKQVTNLTSNPYRRFHFDLGVDLYLDLKEVIHVILKATEKIKSISQITPKPPSILVLKPGDFSNILRVRCWVESKKGVLGAQSALIKQIHKEFYQRGWSFPYPTQTLIFDKDTGEDVNKRAAEYIKKHKYRAKKNLESTPQSLAQEAALVQQREEILTQKIPDQGSVIENPPLFQQTMQTSQAQFQDQPPAAVQNMLQNTPMSANQDVLLQSQESLDQQPQQISVSQPPLIVEQIITPINASGVTVPQPPLTNENLNL